MPRKRPPSTVEVGVSGLRHYGGRIAEEFHPNLKGPKAAKVYEEMRDNDAVIGAILYTIESYLRKAPWKVEAAGGANATPEQVAEKEFLEGVLGDMERPWEDVVSDILSFLPYGYSLHEVVYKVRVGPKETNERYRSDFDDARFGWRDLALRPQTTIDRWDIDAATGKILGAFQKAPDGYATADEFYLPMSRCVLFRTRPFKNNPEGKSILRNAYRSWYLKRRLEEIEAIGVARDLNGLPVVKVPAQIMSPTASAAQKATRAEMERLVSLIHRDDCEGIVFPSEFVAGEVNTNSGYSIELMTTNGGQKLAADPIIRRYDARIAMSCAAEFLILGTEKQGSFALGAEKSANFVRSLYWYINTIVATLNKGPVKWLYDANDVPVENRARLCVGDLDKPDLMAFGTFLGALATNGLLHPTPAVEEKLREVANLPTESDELAALFEEEKALAEEQRQLDAEVAMAGAEAKMMGAQAKVPAPAPKAAAKPKVKK